MNLRTTGLFVVQTNMPQKYFYIQTDLLFGAEYKVFEGFSRGRVRGGKSGRYILVFSSRFTITNSMYRSVKMDISKKSFQTWTDRQADRQTDRHLNRRLNIKVKKDYFSEQTNRQKERFSRHVF